MYPLVAVNGSHLKHCLADLMTTNVTQLHMLHSAEYITVVNIDVGGKVDHSSSTCQIYFMKHPNRVLVSEYGEYMCIFYSSVMM